MNISSPPLKGWTIKIKQRIWISGTIKYSKCVSMAFIAGSRKLFEQIGLHVLLASAQQNHIYSESPRQERGTSFTLLSLLVEKSLCQNPVQSNPKLKPCCSCFSCELVMQVCHTRFSCELAIWLLSCSHKVELYFTSSFLLPKKRV